MTDLRRLLRDLDRQGFAISKTGKGHRRLGKSQMTRPIYASATPSCPFAVKKITADIKRRTKGEVT